MNTPFRAIMAIIIVTGSTLYPAKVMWGVSLSQLEFRLINGICAKRSGTRIIEGFNQGLFGVCGEFKPNRFEEVESHGIILDGISLYRSSLVKVRFEDVSFRHAYLKQVKIFRSKFINVDALKINLRGSSIQRSALSKSDFTQGDLRGIKVWETRFDYAKLKGANLASGYFYAVDFKEADLRGADFTGAVFISCLFDGAKIDRQTKLPFSLAQAKRLGMILQ